MSCSHPLIAIRRKSLVEKGKYSIKILSSDKVDQAVNLRQRYGDDLLFLPCGHCESCKLAYRKDWAVRCEMESLDHKQSCFLTLTYDDDHLISKPKKEEINRFIKDLRDHFGIKFRYFGCGENGHTTGRAHYHLIMFGYRPDDLKFYGISQSGENMFTSKFIQSIWKRGKVWVEDFSIRAASYVAGYVSKKFDEDNFLIFSTHPGIGFGYMYRDFMKLFEYGNYQGKNGQVHPLPRYFDRICERLGYLNVHTKIDNTDKFGELNKASKYNRGIFQDVEMFNQDGRIMQDKLKRLKRYV